MNTAIYRTEDPALETAEFGAVYRIRAPRTGEPWTLHKISDDCGVDAVGPLDVPDDDEEADADSRALLYRFTWPY